MGFSALPSDVLPLLDPKLSIQVALSRLYLKAEEIPTTVLNQILVQAVSVRNRLQYNDQITLKGNFAEDHN